MGAQQHGRAKPSDFIHHVRYVNEGKLSKEPDASSSPNLTIARSSVKQSPTVKALLRPGDGVHPKGSALEGLSNLRQAPLDAPCEVYLLQSVYKSDDIWQSC